MNACRKASVVLGTLLCLPSLAVNFRAHLINGNDVPAGKFGEVIDLKSCTATVVGPNTILTAGHCATSGAKITFTVNGGSNYTATMTRTKTANLDLAAGITDTTIAGITPATISNPNVAKTGLGLTLLGYGCTDSGASNFPHKLLMGDTAITSLQGFLMTSQKSGGAAICFGDDGGPAMILDAAGGNHIVLGVNSVGNLKDTNNDVRLDIAESRDFLTSFVTDNNGAKICGINLDCGAAPATPTCVISATPNPVHLGNNLTLQLTVQGTVASASIDGTPVTGPEWKKIFAPTSAGTFPANGIVTGPGGASSTCTTTYVVDTVTPPAAPTCTLTANPSNLKVGQSLTLNMTTSGAVTFASIDGQSVTFPSGSISVANPPAGLHASTGVVAGPGGSTNCQATYNVEGTVPVIPGVVTNYTVLPTYCGNNIVAATNVAQVCVGVVKYSATKHDIAVKDVVIVTYRDNSEEILPVFNRSARPKPPFDLQTTEDLDLYTNVAVTQGTMGFVTKTAVITSVTPDGGGSPVPQAIRGNGSKGSFFMVNQLSPLNSSTLARWLH